ncbi:MAG: hypothetical protein SOY50_05885 [Ruminococcus callidus]|nr:hypothetical protein [Ruminococcus callidus]
MLKQLQKHRITSRQCMREGLYGMPIGAGNCKKPANNFSTAFPESNSIFSATPHKARLTAFKSREKFIKMDFREFENCFLDKSGVVC